VKGIKTTPQIISRSYSKAWDQGQVLRRGGVFSSIYEADSVTKQKKDSAWQSADLHTYDMLITYCETGPIPAEACSPWEEVKGETCARAVRSECRMRIIVKSMLATIWVGWTEKVARADGLLLW
jgi:hypothetical protein